MSHLKQMVDAIQSNQAYLDTVLLNAHTADPINNPSMEAVYDWLEDEIGFPDMEQLLIPAMTTRVFFELACEWVLENATPADWQRIIQEMNKRGIPVPDAIKGKLS